MTNLEAARVLMIIQTAYPRFYQGTASKEAVSLWAAMFAKDDAEEVARAVYNLVAESPYPPTVADVRRELARTRYGDLPDSGEAWAEVRMAIRRYGYLREPDALGSLSPAAREAARRLGWESLCLSENENEMADRAHFMRIYGEIRERELSARQGLPGVFRPAITDMSAPRLTERKTSPEAVGSLMPDWVRERARKLFGGSDEI